MLLRVDPEAPEPLFEQLAASVRASAMDGSVRAGERLPSAREVAKSLSVNVHTVLRAYGLLREEGLIDLRPGRGAVVTARAAGYRELNDDIPKLIERAKALGMPPATLVALVRAAFSPTPPTREIAS